MVQEHHRAKFAPETKLSLLLPDFRHVLHMTARNQTYPKGDSYSSPLPLSSLPRFSSLPFPPHSVPSSALPPFQLEVGPLKSSWEVWGSAVSSPSGVWGRAPAEIEFGAF